jgi:exportin-2 (importin alpha re-exporter)
VSATVLIEGVFVGLIVCRLWSQILNNFVIPQVPKMPPKDRKVSVVGMIRMLTESGLMMQEPSVQVW